MSEETRELETDETEHVAVVEQNMELIYSKDSLIDTQIATAQDRPRNVMLCLQEAIDIATMDLETAISCNYSFPRAGKIITGESIGLAQIMVQTWGNFRAGARVIGTDDKHVFAQGIAFDLQKNTSVTLEVKRSIMQHEVVNGKRTGQLVRMSEDMITVTGNACASIAFRNSVFKVIPGNITRKVYQAAIEVITGDCSTDDKFTKRKTQLFETMRVAFGVTDYEILKVIGKENIKSVAIMDLVSLYGISQAIRTNEISIETAFRSSRKKAKKNDPLVTKANQDAQLVLIKKHNEKHGETMAQSDKDWVSRVIKNKTVNSYTKVLLYFDELEKSKQ